MILLAPLQPTFCPWWHPAATALQQCTTTYQPARVHSMTITQSALPCTKELMLRAADLVMEQHCCCTDWSPLDKSLHVLGHLFACRHQALRRSSICTGQAMGFIAHCMLSCFRLGCLPWLSTAITENLQATATQRVHTLAPHGRAALTTMHGGICQAVLRLLHAPATYLQRMMHPRTALASQHSWCS
jgi:hypothetical protein